MFLVLIVFLFLPSISLGWLSPLTEVLHTWCLDRIAAHTSQIEIQSALICGERLPFGKIRKIFTDAGLIHLMVVSGAHLIFLEKNLNFLPQWPYKNLFTAFCLIFYSLVAELHPPIFRALISFFLSAFSKKFQLHWNSYWRVMFSGIICIILNPHWISSISLQLSWTGALAFSYSKHSKLMAQILSYMLILPLISQWTTIHPLSIGLNWILFPLISITLFPLSILSFIFPYLYPITQVLWSSMIQFLTFLQPFLEKIPFYINPIPFSFRWIYIGILFLIFQILEKIIYKTKK